MQALTGLLRISDLTAAQLDGLLTLAGAMKQDPERWADCLRRRSVACIYEKPSPRTRVSMTVAADRLGMRPIELRAEESQLARGETVEDTGRVLSEYVDLIVLRTFAHQRVRRLAGAATVPVINALSDDHHPCQALADLLTLRECFGDLAGIKLAFIGDAGSNICHSILEAGALAGMNIVVATPPRYGPDREVLAAATAVAARHGGNIEVITSVDEALRGAHAVYPEIWVPMDKDGEREQRLDDLSGYQVDTELMALARPEAVFLHCLPAFRGQEVTSEIIDGPRSVVWQQAGNRVHTTQALMHTLVTGHS